MALNLDPKPRKVKPTNALRLNGIRRGSSLRLDERSVKPRGSDEVMPMPPYVHWGQFMNWFRERWKVGEHITGVGETGSGKTTLFRNVVTMRDFVCIMGTKSHDPDLYPALEAKGFVKVTKWSPYDWRETRERYVIFAPPLDIPNNASDRDLAIAEAEQASAFRQAMIEINHSGGWCVDFDEVATIAIDLGLKRPLNLLYREARSKSITIAAATQRPREVPLNIFQQAKFLFFWQIADRDDRERAAAYTGPAKPVIDYAVARLPRYEFVCIHKPTQEIIRSRVGG